MRALSIAVLVLCALCGNASAWGDLGHKIVCEIAFRAAPPTTRAEIRRLIELDDRFDNFADSCTGPDHPHTRPSEHFINLERTATKLTSEDCPTAPQCLLTAIKLDLKRLSQADSDEKKLVALKFRGHWLGDIHQPLHVSFEDDRGGNGIFVSGECVGKLHSTWDTCLVTKAVGSDVKEAARTLLKAASAADREDWIASEPIDWANESYAIARAPATKYCTLQGGSCVGPTGTVEIDQDYVTMSDKIIKERLVKAGVRLAHLIDTALGRNDE